MATWTSPLITVLCSMNFCTNARKTAMHKLSFPGSRQAHGWAASRREVWRPLIRSNHPSPFIRRAGAVRHSRIIAINQGGLILSEPNMQEAVGRRSSTGSLTSSSETILLNSKKHAQHKHRLKFPLPGFLTGGSWAGGEEGGRRWRQISDGNLSRFPPTPIPKQKRRLSSASFNSRL